MEEDSPSAGAGGSLGFSKHRRGEGQEPTLHLYVANCGPAVGLSFSAIKEAFESVGEVTGIRAAGDSGTRVVISFRKVEDAVAVMEAWSGRPCDRLQGRVMYMQYSVPRSSPVVEDQEPAMTTAKELQIPGLAIYPDFVSIDEEQELLAAVDQLPWQNLAKRRVQHYGYEFLYKSRNVDLSQKLGNLPTFVGKEVEKIGSLPELTQANELSLPLDQLTVNEYPRGVGLSPHIDTHSAFEGSIISLSLAGPCVMEFRRYPSSDNPGESSGYEATESSSLSSAFGESPNGISKRGMERKKIFLPQRSLLILSDEARYAWHHYIPHHKVDQLIGQIVPRGSRRVSFTFRKVRSGPCKCNFVKDCDSQNSDLSGSPFLSNAEKTECSDLDNSGADIMVDHAEGESHSDECPLNESSPLRDVSDVYTPTNSEAVGLPQIKIDQTENSSEMTGKPISLSAPEIEKRYVHKVYDAIAPHFSATRFAKWPKVALFLDSLAPGSLVADSGCGNGKYLGYNPNCFFIGCDISAPLVAICSRKGQEALVADALNLPYKTGFYDAAISIAVLHHLSNENRRKRAIEELLRVVCSGGKVLITVWAREQEDKDLLKKWTPLSDRYVEEWVNDEGLTNGRRQDLSSSLDRIQEGDGCIDCSIGDRQGSSNGIETEKGVQGGVCLTTPADIRQEDQDQAGKAIEDQQEYFVPWHLPYHRAEANGASAALANGLARKDEKKGTLVYNRYYHMFAERELERLATGVSGAEIVDQFFDKSNWCVILRKL
ncbi:unnamed protein product [Calypogeia fissa]